MRATKLGATALMMAVVGAVIGSGVMHRWAGAGVPDPKDDPPAKAGDAEVALKEQIRESARVVYEAELKRFATATGSGVESVSRWSHRWLESELDLASDATAKTSALKAHLDRMKGIEKTVTALVKVGQLTASDAAVALYFRTRAELWVARGRVQ